MYIPPAIQIAPFVGIRRERILPYTGRVGVAAGDDVEADDIVATARGQGRLHIVDVAQKLRIPNEQAIKAIVAKADQKLEKGTVIAVQKSLFGAIRLRSPVKGRVAIVLGGRILIAADTRPVELRALLPGRVMEIRADLGIMIETTGAVIQGVWGNGKQAYGEMQMLGRGDVEVEAFNEELAGLIMVAAGTLADARALQAATRAHLAGLILGSFPTAMLPAVNRMKFPIMITEGFGKHKMLPTTWGLLSDSATRRVNLNAQTPDRARGRRPEVLIPIGAAGDMPPKPASGEMLAVGHRVRLLRAPYAGMSGVIARLPNRPQRFPSGVRVQAARVSLDQNSEQVLVPQANLELIEQGFEDEEET